MALTVHLWIQKERGFDRGCWGVTAGSPAAANTGCTSRNLEGVGEMFGVSTAAWGYGFYFSVALLALARVLLPSPWPRRCQVASDVAVGAAFTYSAYLVYYQAVVARAYCPLCLVSAGLITVLFVLHVVQRARSGFTPLPDPARVWEAGWAAGMVFAAAGVLVAGLIFVDRLGLPGSDQGPDARRFEAMVGRALPAFIDAERLREWRPTGLDSSVPPLPLADWLTPEAPRVGTADGPSLVVFLDPNCPHCAGTYAAVMKVAGRYQDRAGFYVLPRALWEYSLLQVQALELARQAGNYHEMWRRQFEQRRPGGMNFAQVERLFRELQLDTTGLRERLEGVRPAVLAQRSKAGAAGLNSTPAIFFNGIAVTGFGRTEEGLARLIERAVPAGAASPEKTKQAVVAP